VWCSKCTSLVILITRISEDMFNITRSIICLAQTRAKLPVLISPVPNEGVGLDSRCSDGLRARPPDLDSRQG
jgi:hypothetical protein